MKIALIGYGKMGRLVEEIARQREHSIVAKIDPHRPEKEITQESLRDADVCIDFSHPDSVVENIRTVAKLKRNLVVGTTGWYDRLAEVRNIVAEHNIGFFYTSNFSIGVNIFLKIVHAAASLMNHFDEYDVGGVEMHHNQKADSPSGTAHSIARILLENIKRKNRMVWDIHHTNQVQPDEIHFASVRCGSIPGHHEVIFDSPSDTIKLIHEARNREGFASGAVAAAEWLLGKKGFYTMGNLLEGIF